MIPFLRTYPDGRRSVAQIERGADVELLARRFAKLGGRYQLAVMADGAVKLAASIIWRGSETVVEDVETANSTELPQAVDRLVRLSDLHVAEMWLADATDLPRA